jgi:hypothetical protein
MDENNKNEEIIELKPNFFNRKNKWPIKWLVILDILCLTLGVIGGSMGLYDIYHLKQIEHRCLDDCNKHWVNELDKIPGCQTGLFDSSDLNYSYSIPTT